MIDRTDDQIVEAVRKYGSKAEAARQLGMARRTLTDRYAKIGPKAGGPAAIDRDERELLHREISSLQAENRRLVNESADMAALKRFIGTASKKLDASPDWALKIPRTSKLVHGIPTLMLSDLHFGETVFSGQVNGVNEYNVSIAKRRLKRVVSGAVKLLRHTLAPGEFGGIVCIFGGDMLDGVIHDELRDTADETAIESVVTLHDELVPALKVLCDEFGRVHVPCVVGNHGRLDRKPRMKNGPKLNLDWLLYQFVARTIEADPKYRSRITFQIPDGFDCSYKIFGTRYMLTHGDSFRGGSGITGPLLPWMRGDAKTRKQYGALGLPYDVLLMGHWHQLRYLGQIIVNGCLVGFNEYALKSRFDYEPPMQALWLTHPSRGLTFQEGVFAEDPKPAKETGWVSLPNG